MFISLVEPHIQFNGQDIKNVFVSIQEYSILDFYENRWVDQIKHKRNKLLEILILNQYQHPLIRNYLELIKKRFYHLHLVQKYKDETSEYVVLHTYKLNIFKRKWRNNRNYRNNRDNYSFTTILEMEVQEDDS